MRTIIISLLLLCSTLIWAQRVKRPDSYNYTRGVEAIQNNNVEEALEYLNKEVNDNPDNGYAFAWIALVQVHLEKYGQALTAVNMAIKKIPSKDKEYTSFAYSTRASVYLNLEDTVRAIKDYSQAISITPEESDIYSKRAQIYYEQGKYSLADADYHKMISLNEGDVVGYMGIGRNANAQKQWNEAIKQFDYVVKLAPDYSSAYSFRAESYWGLNKFDKAIDDVVIALSIDADNKAFYLLQSLVDTAFVQTIAKLKAQKIKEPNENYWNYCLGTVYEHLDRYSDAIAYYEEAIDKESSDAIAYRLAHCYNDKGDYERALYYCNQAISIDSTESDYIFYKAIIEDNYGRINTAIETMDSFIKKNPDNGYGYYSRGWLKDRLGDSDGAIEDYMLSIAMIPEYVYCYLHRGILYRLKGEIEAANNDFKQVITLDTIKGNIECAQFAYYYLGNKEKAIEIVDEMLKNNDKDDFYDAACLYSIMGEKEKSIGYLRKSLELGFRRFSHIARDRDLDNIRNEKDFIDLIQEYMEIHNQETKTDSKDDTIFEERTEEIPFTKEGDMCKVKCSINGLPLHFIFDTGASDVSLSSVEATFMMKNGYLSASDVIGKQQFLNASGEVSEGTVINLREVKFGSLHLDNVRASVARNQSAPLLLGQSVLNRLGRIEIDNTKRNLKITYNIKK